MTTQEEAFRAYYSSMTDAQLVKIAANRASFITTAQKILADEMAKRRLAVPPKPAPQVSPGVLARLVGRLRHAPPH